MTPLLAHHSMRFNSLSELEQFSLCLGLADVLKTAPAELECSAIKAADLLQAFRNFNAVLDSKNRPLPIEIWRAVEWIESRPLNN